MVDEPIFYDGLSGLIRTMTAVPFIYLTAVAAIRISGKRSTSQMNNFDWVVTFALGSLVASGIVLKGVTVIETIAAMLTLMFLQWILTSLSCRYALVRRLTKPEPALVYHEGEFLYDRMIKERLSEAEVLSAIRESGVKSLDNVQSVVFETNAKMSVLKRQDASSTDDSAMADVAGLPAEHKRRYPAGGNTAPIEDARGGSGGAG